jgi:sigma-B regulation protein RsbU (phosphoserine phosphatase)
MQREVFTRGQVLFRMGDRADKLFYINRGAIRLPELNIRVGPGEFIGETGILSPLKRRTASAVCEEDLEVYSMDQRQVMELFRQDPALALSLVQLGVKRLIEDLKIQTQARERTLSELRIARDIQLSTLPHSFPQKSEFETHALMEPASEVGGDFYDVFTVGKRKLYLVLGDASGKGISAALFMAISRSLIRGEAQRGFSPDRVLSHVNKLLCPDNHRCMFVTVSCAMLDTQTGEVQICDAGHFSPVLCRNDGRAEFLQVPGGMALGIVPTTTFAVKRVILAPGDSLLFYTDGVTEAVDDQQQLFSDGRLLTCLKGKQRESLKRIIEGVRSEVAVHVGNEANFDDITMLAVRFRGARAKLDSPSQGRSKRVRKTGRATLH